MKCEYCGSTRVHKRGSNTKKFLPLPTIRYQCKDCGKYGRLQPRHARTAKILLLDIETMYMEVNGVWDLKTEYIAHDRITKDWSIVCWGAKWLFEEEIMGQVVAPEEVMSRTEASVMGGIWKLMDEADIVVTQNGVGFDIPRLNTKFAKYNFPPPSHYLNVDTLAAARKAFYLPSYSLDYVGKHVLGTDGKIKMRIGDWDACATGDEKALKKMLKYCKWDIAPLLEDWYLYLLPWMKSHPNLGIYPDHDSDVCPRCESTDLSWNTSYRTPKGLWQGFRCNSCGSIGRGTTKAYKEKGVRIVS